MVTLDQNASHFEVVYTFTPSAPRPNVSAVVVVLVSHFENSYLFLGAYVQVFLVSFVHEILDSNLT